MYLVLYYVAVRSYNSNCDRTINHSNHIRVRLEPLDFGPRNGIYKLIC
jgi:hypothetical protein